MGNEPEKNRKFPPAIIFMLFVSALLVVSIGLIGILRVTKPVSAADPNAEPLKLNCLVVLDAGHGGKDCGAIGRKTGVHEDELNLDVAQKLQKLLTDAGAEVIMTRETEAALADTKSADMEKRREIIKESGADIVVSIHMNFFSDTSSAGPQVFYYENSSGGRALAMSIQSKMNDLLQPDSPRTYMKGDYYVLRAGDAPAVIVECGFLSNDKEELLLKDEKYRQNIAQSVLEGIRAYFQKPEELDTMDQ